MSEHKEWEYIVHSMGSIFRGPKDEELVAVLDEWGEDGWELVSAFNTSNSTRITLIAKRPLTQTSRRKRSLP